MKIVVNGAEREVPPGTTVAALIRALGLASERVAVELDGALLPRAEHERTALAEGDRLELVTLVGGG